MVIFHGIPHRKFNQTAITSNFLLKLTYPR